MTASNDFGDYLSRLSRTYRSRAGRLSVVDRDHSRFTRSAQRGMFRRRALAVARARDLGFKDAESISKCPVFGLAKTPERRPCCRYRWCASCWARVVSRYFTRFEKALFGKSYGRHLLTAWQGTRLVVVRRRLLLDRVKRPWRFRTNRWAQVMSDARRATAHCSLDHDYRRLGGLAGVACVRLQVERHRVVLELRTVLVRDARLPPPAPERSVSYRSLPALGRKQLVSALAGALRYPEGWWDTGVWPLLPDVFSVLTRERRSMACYGALRRVGDLPDQMPPELVHRLKQRKRKEARRGTKPG